MLYITEQIRQHLARQPAGAVVTPRDLLIYGARASVDQALKRLVGQGALERVARGLYAIPRHNALVGKVALSPQAVAQGYARARGRSTARHGAQVLLEQGLSTQTPLVPVLYADLPGERRVRSGEREVILRHAPRYVLSFAGTPVGEALSALHHLGAGQPQSARALLARLEADTFSGLLEARPQLPGWLADLLTGVSREVGPLGRACHDQEPR